MNRLNYYDKTLKQWTPFTADDAETFGGKTAADFYNDLEQQLNNDIDTKLGDKANKIDLDAAASKIKNFNSKLLDKELLLTSEFSVDTSTWVTDGFTIYAYQSCAFSPTKIYLAFVEQNSNLTGRVLLAELDRTTRAVLRTAILPLYHANGMCYCPNYNGKEVIINANMYKNNSGVEAFSKTLTVVDLATLTVLETKETSYNVRNIAYDSKNNQFVCSTYDNSTMLCTIWFLNPSTLETIKTITATKTGLSSTMGQASEVFDDMHLNAYVFDHCITVTDYDGNILKVYGINADKYGEIETITSVGNGDMLLGFNTHPVAGQTTAKFYRTNILKLNKVQKNGEVEDLRNDIATTIVTSAKGYRLFPGGYIELWGSLSGLSYNPGVNNAFTVNFDVATFGRTLSTVYNAQVTLGGTGKMSGSVTALTSSGMTINVFNYDTVVLSAKYIYYKVEGKV